MRIDPAARRLDGEAEIVAVNRSSAAVRSAPLLLYRLMRVSSIHDGTGAPLQYQDRIVELMDDPTWQARQIVVALPTPLQPGDSTTLRVAYGGYLAGYAETGWRYLHDRIDSAYSLIRTDTYAYPVLRPPSHLIARRAGYPTHGYRARITVPAGFVVANGGELVSRADSAGWTTFEYRDIRPSWRMDFAVAPFVLRREGGLRMYHLRQDSTSAAYVMQAMQRGSDLFTRWFGPLRGSSSFTLIEIPDGWGSQTDVAAVLESAAAFHDTSSVRELYHELSHRWNVRATEGEPSRWEEGLASFLEDLAVDSLHGRTTTDRNAQWYVGRLRERVRRDARLGTIPMRDFGRVEMTDYSYSVGGLMFYCMYRMVGHATFARIVGEYYRRYGSSGGTLDDFATLARQQSPVSLDALFGDWLESTRWAGMVGTADAIALPQRYMPRGGQD